MYTKSDTIAQPPPALHKLHHHRRPMKPKLAKTALSSARINLNQFWDKLEAYESITKEHQCDQWCNHGAACDPKDQQKASEEELSVYSLYLWEQVKKAAELQKLKRQMAEMRKKA